MLPLQLFLEFKKGFFRIFLLAPIARRLLNVNSTDYSGADQTSDLS